MNTNAVARERRSISKKTTCCFVAEVGDTCIVFNEIIQSSLVVGLTVLEGSDIFQFVVLGDVSAHLLGLKIS